MEARPTPSLDAPSYRLSFSRSGKLLAVMAILLFVPAYFLSVALLFLMGSVLLALIVYNFLAVLGRLKDLSLDLVFPGAYFAQGEGEALLLLHHRGRVRKLLNLRISLAIRGMEVQPAIVDLLKSQTLEVPLLARAQDRGWAEAHACTLQLGYPFGLVEVMRRVPLNERALVYPALLAEPVGPLLSERDAPNRLPSGGDDFVYLAAYQPGEDVRRIHWKKSTLTAQPVVKKDLAQMEIVTPHLLVPDTCPHFEFGLSVLATHFQHVHFATSWDVLTATGLVRVHTREEMLGQLALAAPLAKDLANPYVELGYELLFVSDIKSASRN